jgi:hypothetical protein
MLLHSPLSVITLLQFCHTSHHSNHRPIWDVQFLSLILHHPYHLHCYRILPQFLCTQYHAYSECCWHFSTVFQISVFLYSYSFTFYVLEEIILLFSTDIYPLRSLSSDYLPINYSLFWIFCSLCLFCPRKSKWNLLWHYNHSK